MLWLIINIILCLSASYIIYNTTLSFLGVYLTLKQLILPVAILGSILFLSKFIFKSNAIVHTVLIVILCSILVYLFNHVNFLISIISSLVTTIIITFGSLLFVCPFYQIIGLNLNNIDFKTIDWVILNIGELFIPLLVLIINKTFNFSILVLLFKEIEREE